MRRRSYAAPPSPHDQGKSRAGHIVASHVDGRPLRRMETASNRGARRPRPHSTVACPASGSSPIPTAAKEAHALHAHDRGAVLIPYLAAPAHDADAWTALRRAALQEGETCSQRVTRAYRLQPAQRIDSR